MDGVICAILFVLITVAAEIVIKKSDMHMWLKRVADSDTRKFLITGFYRKGLEIILIYNSRLG